MAGLDPAIHVFVHSQWKQDGGSPGTSPVTTNLQEENNE
jgi:hypothetical protein